MSFALERALEVRVWVISHCSSPIPICLVEGLMLKRDYTLVYLMALHIRGGALVVPMLLLSAVKALVVLGLLGGLVFSLD